MLKNLSIITSLIFFVTVASANIRVSPTKLELSQKRRIESLNVKNVSNVKKKFQSVLVKKNYSKKGNPQEPTRDLMVTPVVFVLEPDSTQLIRIIAKQSIQESKEKDEYRILVKELPLNPLDTNGIGFLTALSVPINIVDIKKELKAAKEADNAKKSDKSKKK